MFNYVYQLKFKPTGCLYIGARKCNEDPVNDLWVKYFSSSKVVKNLIKNHGADSFEFKVVKVFNDFNEALDFEHFCLKLCNAAKNPLFLNQVVPGESFRSNIRLPETNEKIRKTLKGRPNPRKGKKLKPCSDEKKEKLRIAGKRYWNKRINEGNKRDTWALKMSEEIPMHWYNKNTDETFIGNRRQLKNYDPCVYVPELGWVINGKSKSHKGWMIIDNSR
jgi:hypothetical protein